MFKLIEKNTNKKYSTPCRVQPFYWAFEPVDSWLWWTKQFTSIVTSQ